MWLSANPDVYNLPLSSNRLYKTSIKRNISGKSDPVITESISSYLDSRLYCNN